MMKVRLVNVDNTATEPSLLCYFRDKNTNKYYLLYTYGESVKNNSEMHEDYVSNVAMQPGVATVISDEEWRPVRDAMNEASKGHPVDNLEFLGVSENTQFYGNTPKRLGLNSEREQCFINLQNNANMLINPAPANSANMNMGSGDASQNRFFNSDVVSSGIPTEVVNNAPVSETQTQSAFSMTPPVAPTPASAPAPQVVATTSITNQPASTGSFLDTSTASLASAPSEQKTDATQEELAYVPSSDSYEVKEPVAPIASENASTPQVEAPVTTPIPEPVPPAVTPTPVPAPTPTTSASPTEESVTQVTSVPEPATSSASESASDEELVSYEEARAAVEILQKYINQQKIINENTQEKSGMLEQSDQTRLASTPQIVTQPLINNGAAPTAFVSTVDSTPTVSTTPSVNTPQVPSANPMSTMGVTPYSTPGGTMQAAGTQVASATPAGENVSTGTSTREGFDSNSQPSQTANFGGANGSAEEQYAANYVVPPLTLSDNSTVPYTANSNQSVASSSPITGGEVVIPFGQVNTNGEEMPLSPNLLGKAA